MIKKTYFISITLIIYVVIIACKSAILGPTYPIDDFTEYDYVVIATVDKAKHSKEGYFPLESFEVTIKKSLKGNLELGVQIIGQAKIEKARAVCPVHLDKNSDYLLLLTKESDGYKLSRFSFPVKKGYSYFDNYIKQIKESLSTKEKN